MKQKAKEVKALEAKGWKIIRIRKHQLYEMLHWSDKTGTENLGCSHKEVISDLKMQFHCSDGGEKVLEVGLKDNKRR